jgi:tetratricopeptide (TPR) repeat protein
VPDLQRIEDLRRRVQRDPASIAFAQLAEELRRAHEFDESVAICRAGLEIHPEYLSARVTLGRALLELNALDEAEEELARVLRSAPENLAAIRGLGEIHHRRGHLVEALAQYRAALALARNDPDLEEIVARLAKEVEPQKPAIPTDGLSFDDMHAELLNFVPAAARPSPPAPPSPVASELTLEPAPSVDMSSASEPEPAEPLRDSADPAVAALEGWLEAIHVARADRRP